tara:strand:+ start:286 stop:1206 length:921 start_codon:yes stop_codon:yes gene_type:complete
MGLLRKIRRRIKKIIPKEIRPALPFIAAAVPGLGMGITGLSAKSALGSFLRAGITKGLSDDEADVGDVLRTASIAAAPQAISKGLGSISQATEGTRFRELATKPGSPFALGKEKVAGESTGIIKEIGELAGKASAKIAEPDISGIKSLADVGTQAKLLGTQTGIDVISEQLKLQEKLLDDQGITDKSDRRQQLFDYFTKIDYGSEDEINSLLDRYGYKGFAGGGIASMRPMYAEGGIMDLGGNEMDLRGGGFVPIGKKEKADDVPARLSKNEFVMTADAVRGAGGGNINVGAKRMYDMMNQYEMMA